MNTFNPYSNNVCSAKNNMSILNEEFEYRINDIQLLINKIRDLLITVSQFNDENHLFDFKSAPQKLNKLKIEIANMNNLMNETFSGDLIKIFAIKGKILSNPIIYNDIEHVSETSSEYKNKASDLTSLIKNVNNALKDLSKFKISNKRKREDVSDEEINLPCEEEHPIIFDKEQTTKEKIIIDEESSDEEKLLPAFKKMKIKEISEKLDKNKNAEEKTISTPCYESKCFDDEILLPDIGTNFNGFDKDLFNSRDKDATFSNLKLKATAMEELWLSNTDNVEPDH